MNFHYTFVIVKHTFSKFLAVSVLIISSLGGIKCDTLTHDGGKGLGHTIGVDASAIVDRSLVQRDAQIEKPENKDEGQFGFEFPNIFDGFRSLF